MVKLVIHEEIVRHGTTLDIHELYIAIKELSACLLARICRHNTLMFFLKEILTQAL